MDPIEAPDSLPHRSDLDAELAKISGPIRPRILTGWMLGKALVDAGIVPHNCGRIVIDIPVDGVVTIFQDVFADERLLRVFRSTPETMIVTGPSPLRNEASC